MCITPLTVVNRIKAESMPVDCGRCPECIAKRTSQWSFRLRKEAEVSTSAYFITLTYDTEHVPITRNGYMTLRLSDVQKWLKRLRKISKEKIKYYYVGEYGSKTNRPHYHAIIFNAEMEDIDTTWHLGQVHYGTVSGASIGYTLKYMCKDGRIPMHKNDDRVPEFGNMSKGIGANYLTAETMYYHTEKRALLERVCCVIDGKKVSMPRYYKDKIYDQLHKQIIMHEAKKLQFKKEELKEKFVTEKVVEAHLAKFQKMKNDKYKGKSL